MSETRNIYVAVVDDDESACRSFGRLLRAAQIHAITYLSAEAFLEDAKRPIFDCLLLDIQLPGMSGLELARKLAAEKHAAPVIFITAHDEPEKRAQAEAIGCAAFIHKTQHGTDIISAIRNAIGRESAVPGTTPKESFPEADFIKPVEHRRTP